MVGQFGNFDGPIKSKVITPTNNVAIKMATSTSLEGDEKEVEGTKSKITIYQEAIYSRQLDGLILVNFFLFFVVSFIAGLLFLYTSLSLTSLWSFQVCEDGDLYQTITFSGYPKEDIINVITYNASAPLSLRT